MKNIVLLTYDFNVEYCNNLMQGIVAFFENISDVHLILAQVKSKNDFRGTFLYQYSTAVDMVCAEDIDGYIIISTTFGDFLDEIVTEIRKRNKAPIVSIGKELNYENCFTTICDTKEIYCELVGHLVKNHNCKNIGFFSANESNSAEAYERLDSFKQAMEFHKLEVNPDFILHGNFTGYRAKQIIAEKYTSREEVPFDAIICANDLTAVGCQEALDKIGVSVPEDVKVIGFDDSNQASLSNPSISTVNQQIKQQGYITAELIYNKVSGKKCADKASVLLAPVYRQSCGCIAKTNNDYVYKNKDGELITQSTDYREFLKNYYDKMNDSRSINVIFDFMHSNSTLQDFCKDLDLILRYTSFKGMSINLFDKPIIWNAGETFILPEKAKLITLNDRTRDLRVHQKDEIYNPNKKIVPEEFNDVPGLFILHPIYNCSTAYGYFLSHFTELKMDIYGIHLKIINQAIAQATEASKNMEITHRLEMEKEDLERTNSDLAKQSKTDELTKILNRRGFMEYGQQQINLSISMNTSGAIFFADLDGLKKINDNYGHKMGDLAIQLAAKALKMSFRRADIVGRLSGDEFAVVATDMSLELLERTRMKLDRFCHDLQKDNNLPFTLSLSLGGVGYSEENYYLKELLIKADENLYEEKQRHHERLNIQ